MFDFIFGVQTLFLESGVLIKLLSMVYSPQFEKPNFHEFHDMLHIEPKTAFE